MGGYVGWDAVRVGRVTIKKTLGKKGKQNPQDITLLGSKNASLLCWPHLKRKFKDLKYI